MVFALSCSPNMECSLQFSSQVAPGLVLARENTDTDGKGGQPMPVTQVATLVQPRHLDAAGWCSIALRNDQVSPKYICEMRGPRKGLSSTSYSEKDSKGLRVPASTS